MTDKARKCVVLVTGGAGFLGQHIIGVLQSRAHHVTEIRILDTAIYANKLDYPDNIPVRQFTGSILDVNLVRKACTGVTSVFHIASVIDTSLIPDEKRSYDINVIGTHNVIDACKAAGVKRLIYCSTVEVVSTPDSIYDGTEDMPYASGYVFETYGRTKTMAEQAVRTANEGAQGLVTLSIRPTVMYGEQDWGYIGRIINVARRFGRYPRFDSRDGRVMHVYVGNVAWCFVCAENALHEDDARAERLGGHVFFVGDDSPVTDMSTFNELMFKPVGAKPTPFSIPCWVLVSLLWTLNWLLRLISIVYRVNIDVNTAVFRRMTQTYVYSYDKAKELLDYEPLYTFDQAKERSTAFLSDIYNGRTG